MSVGVHPYDAPSPLGTVVRDASRSTIVLALRSSTRAAPLVLLALALAVGAALTALRSRLPAASVAGSLAVVALAAANLPTLWNGTYVDALLRRPSAIPAYWHQAADALSASDDGTPRPRAAGGGVRRLPVGHHHRPDPAGAHRPSHAHARPAAARRRRRRWTSSTPSTTASRRGWWSPAPSRRWPASSAPAPSSTGATPPSSATARRGPSRRGRSTTAGAPGLGAPDTSGRRRPTARAVADVDETTLVRRPHRPAGAARRHRGGRRIPTPIVRARDAGHATVVDGSGDGIVDAAAAGLLDDPGIVLAPAAFAGDPDAAPRRHPPRRPARRDRHQPQAGRAVARVAGHDGLHRGRRPRRAGGRPGRQPPPRVPGRRHRRADARRAARAAPAPSPAPTASRTRTGPEDRADQAIDGDVGTAWRVGDRGEVIGQRLRIELPSARHVDHVTVVQPLDAAANRWITRLTRAHRRRRDDGRRSPTSRGRPPASASTCRRPTTSWVELEVAGTNVGPDRRTTPASTPSAWPRSASTAWPPPKRSCARRPTCSTRLGAASADHPLTYVLTRERVDERDRWRDDPEATIRRVVTVPTGRTFTVGGTAHLTGRQGDAEFAVADVFQQAPAAVATSVLAGLARRRTGGRRWTATRPRRGRRPSAGHRSVGDGSTPAPPSPSTTSTSRSSPTREHSVPTSLSVAAGGRTQPVDPAGAPRAATARWPSTCRSRP